MISSASIGVAVSVAERGRSIVTCVCTRPFQLITNSRDLLSWSLSWAVRTMISSMAVRKIIFLNVGGQWSLCQTSAKRSPIERILISSSIDNEWRCASRPESRCLAASISSSFAFHRRSNSLAASRLRASTASYCSKALFCLIHQLLHLAGQGVTLSGAVGAQFFERSQTGFHPQRRDHL